MPRGIVFFFLVAVWTLRCAAGEPTADESKLKFRALLFPELVFTTADPTNRDGDGKPIPGVRLLPNTFPAEYDFTELLKSYGVSSPPGSLALYFNGALVLRNTPENLDLAAKILAGSDERGNRTSIEVSTYECTFAAGQDLLPWKQLVWADLRRLPAGAVKLIDRTSILMLSNTRNMVSNVTAPAPPNYSTVDAPRKDTAGDLTFQPGETGSSLDVESLEDDVTLRYLVRAPEAGHGNAIGKVSLSTTFIRWEDYPVILHVASAGDQPGKYSVVMGRVTSSDPNAWKFPAAKFPPAPAAEPAKAPVSPLPNGMDIAIWRVPPGFINAPGDDALELFLKPAGVPFQAGSAAFLDRKTNCVIAINTPQNLELIELIVTSGLQRPKVVSVELSSYEFSFPPSAKASDLSRFSFSDLQDLPRNLVQPVGYISLLMRDGEPTKAARITGGAATGDAKSMRPQDDWKFLPGETGEKLEVRPSLGVLPAGLAPGKVVTVGLDVAYTLRLPPKKPGDEITEVALNAAATVTNDEPAILRIVPSGNEAGKYIAIVARAKWVNEGGWKLPR